VLITLDRGIARTSSRGRTATLAAVTAESSPEPPAIGLPARLRLLALLTALEGLMLLTYAAADLVLAAADDNAEWGAVWFVVVGLGLWGVGLIWVSWGLRHRRRWAFTPVLFTQLIFGLIGLTVFGSATVPAQIVSGTVVVLAVVLLWLLFSREVRNALIPPPAG